MKAKGLSWELKVAAQESQKLFLQEIEASFIAQLPPAGGGLHSVHTGQKRIQTSNLADPDFQVPANQEKNGVPSTRDGNSPIPERNRKKLAIQRCSSKNKRGTRNLSWKFTNTSTIRLHASCHASHATTSQKRWNSAYKSNRLFQFWYMLESKHTGFDNTAFGNV